MIRLRAPRAQAAGWGFVVKPQQLAGAKGGRRTGPSKYTVPEVDARMYGNDTWQTGSRLR